MKKTSALIIGSLFAVTALAGCMYPESRGLPPGQYQNKSSSVDAEGTSREQVTDTNVYYDKDGRKQVSTDKHTTKDPKGLFNKSSTESHSSTE